MPQIEVAFDIDANGIVNVSAKDQATGKEQSIQITASSGLSKEEIDKLIRDGELHAEEDKRKRELVEARNTADALIYGTEKTIAEAADKIDSASRMRIEETITSLKKAMEGDAIADIKRLSEELTNISHTLAQTMYQQAQHPDSSQTGCGDQCAGNCASSDSDDDVVDAEYKDVA